MEIAEKKIATIIHSFESYALGDIKRIREYKMPIAAFILGFCFIDQVSGFIYDNNLKGQTNNTYRSKKFVVDYLNIVSKKPYNENDLIDLLRNKLVHNYSLTDRKKPRQQRYLLDYENPSNHLHREMDMVVINIDGFISDLENAFFLYKRQLNTNKSLQQIALKNYDVYGILTHKEVKINNSPD